MSKKLTTPQQAQKDQPQPTTTIQDENNIFNTFLQKHSLKTLSADQLIIQPTTTQQRIQSLQTKFSEKRNTTIKTHTKPPISPAPPSTESSISSFVLQETAHTTQQQTTQNNLKSELTDMNALQKKFTEVQTELLLQSHSQIVDFVPQDEFNAFKVEIGEIVQDLIAELQLQKKEIDSLRAENQRLRQNSGKNQTPILIFSVAGDQFSVNFLGEIFRNFNFLVKFSDKTSEIRVVGGEMSFLVWGESVCAQYDCEGNCLFRGRFEGVRVCLLWDEQPVVICGDCFYWQNEKREFFEGVIGGCAVKVGSAEILAVFDEFNVYFYSMKQFKLLVCLGVKGVSKCVQAGCQLCLQVGNSVLFVNLTDFKIKRQISVESSIIDFQFNDYLQILLENGVVMNCLDQKIIQEEVCENDIKLGIITQQGVVCYDVSGEIFSDFI